MKLGKVNARLGTSKISGFLMTLDGRKRVIKPTTVTEIDGKIPVNVTLEVRNFGNMEVAIGGTKFAGSLGTYHVQTGNVGGTWNSPTVMVSVNVDDVSMFSGTVLEDFLPDGEPVTVTNGKWTFPKATKVKWAKPTASSSSVEMYDEGSGKGLIVDMSNGKTNLSGLKLVYTPRSGMFKGSFKVYELQDTVRGKKLKSYVAKVNGVVVDGVGYGMATCKRPAFNWDVSVE